MAKNYLDEKVEYLFRGILSLETMEDCRAFFEDLCTVKEITEMSRRLEAARMLDESKVYTEIAEETGLSTATISRVNRCLKYGSDGYARVLSRLVEKTHEEEN